MGIRGSLSAGQWGVVTDITCVLYLCPRHHEEIGKEVKQFLQLPTAAGQGAEDREDASLLSGDQDRNDKKND